MITPPLSFVQFEPQADHCHSLPLASADDLCFFVSLNHPFKVAVRTNAGVVFHSGVQYHDPYGLWVTLEGIDLNRVEDGTGMQIVLLSKDGVELYQSNCFEKVSDTRHTSLVEYSLHEAGLGWPCPVGVNKVRLPFYLHEPQYPQSQDLYAYRDGTRSLLYADIGKQYTLVTDYLDAVVHERMVALLSHDEVWIDGRQVFKTDSYNVNWGSKSRMACGELAPATAKVTLDGMQRNGGCGACPPVTCEGSYGGWDAIMPPVLGANKDQALSFNNNIISFRNE